MSMEEPTPTGSAEPKRFLLRPRLAWIIAAALVVVALVAAIYGLRSNDNPPPTVASANQPRLERGRPVKLLPGRVSTDFAGMKASFEVFDHWYGEQRGGGYLALAKHLTTGGFEVDGSRGIEVDALDTPLARSTHRLETASGIRVHNVSSIRLGSHSGRRYNFSLNRLLPLGQGFNIGPQEHDVTLLGVGDKTVVIRKMVDTREPDHGRTRREAERVIQSFRFHS